nr:uncharacterized mitochondrial protein AtMg00810-like [Tanacetum cinerariifolium]
MIYDLTYIKPKPLKKQAQIEQDEAYAKKAAKKQKLDEEVEELKKHLQIVPNDEDDVYTEATPLARKVPVVDYDIYTKNNKPYYKIIRADGTPQLFLSFLSLLRNFDREDLEMILLVERRYPLTRFTLDQMLNNVRLEVEEESEVSLELLRFKQDGIFISQDKYVAEILRKFGLTDGKSASTSIDTEKPLLKDLDGEDVDVHTYRLMIGSLMYLTSSRLDIMFSVCACACFQVSPKASHLHAVKRIFKYLKGKPHLGLWYPKDSPFNLVAYSDSDYDGASLDRKSTTGGCQFLGCRLISWQCKKQTVVATSSTKAKYVAATSCCAQALWIQNQLLDYGYNFQLLDYGGGFEQILDFLNASVIQYALTINTTIYVSCIKQFWSSILIKKTNDVVRLQALIDKRKVIITEDTVRQALHLDDTESIDCMPNEEIFVELVRMGYEKPSTKLIFYKAFFLAQWKFLIHTIVQCMSAKRTAWNEFISFMASVVICLATGRKFNFLKYIFDSLVRNVDSSSKFYMYPRFLQLMISAQVSDLSFHTTKYTSLSLTQKVFANMRRVGKGFSEVDTPLFEGMSVPQQVGDDVVADDIDDVATDDIAEDVTEPTPPSPTPAITPPPSQELPSTSQVAPTPPPSPIAQPSSPPQQQQPSQTTEISIDLLNTLLETYTTLTKRDVTFEEVAAIAKDAEVAKKDDDELEPAELKEVIEVVTTAKLMTKVTAVATTITTAPVTAATITAAPSATRKRKRRKEKCSWRKKQAGHSRGKVNALSSKQSKRRSLIKSFGVDVVEDFKEYTLKNYYCWLKIYCCWYKLKLLDNAADSRLRLLEESAVADDKMKK